MSERTRSPLGRYDDAAASSQLHEVHLIGLPLQILASSRQHHDELMREFALLALSREPRDSDDETVPTRFMQLVEVLGERYGRANNAPDAAIDAAIERGEVTTEITFVVPSEVVGAAAALEELMTEADEFCRKEQLLTLERSEVEVNFARWYLGEFRRQVVGESPQPWDGPLLP